MQVEAFPKRRLYPVLGFLIALVPPGGLLLFQGLAEGGLGSWDWIREELQTRALTYGYLAVSTAIMFLGLGYVIGSNEDLLQRISLTDPLTGLAKRRLLDKRLREELARVHRYDHPLTLMLLDLDGLKNVNDRRGHEAGGNALRG